MRARGLLASIRLTLLAGLATVGASAWPISGQAAPQLQIARFSVTGPSGPERVVALWCAPPADEKLPVVIAFHGKGESALGPQRGYAAWLERYGLAKAYEALLDSPLSAAAFGGLVRPSQLVALNAELLTRAFQGVLAIGVYTPDLLGPEHKAEEREAYAEWVAHSLLPSVQKELPVASTVARQAGVDGVSLGGMIALEVGLRHPDVFGAVGTMQPAIRGRETELAELAGAARARAHQVLRLLSSDGDPLLPVTKTLSRELRKRHIAHRLIVTPGGHDYAFNRGPGAIELLHFHDRALRDIAD